MNKVLHHYDKNHLPISAERVIAKIMDLLSPKSVVDVGCGLAQWLKVFQNNGVEKVLGIDGSHVPMENFYINQEDFFVYNLEKGNDFVINNKFDLAVSLEVAEHISEDGADGFMKMLSSLSDRILFSAAIPNQTGENHINEQNHIYWQEKFLKHNYFMLDIIRPIIWSDENINWWYRQNMFILVKKDDILFNEDKVFNGNQLIHPELFKMYVDSNKSLQKLLSNQKNIPTSFIGKLKFLIK